MEIGDLKIYETLKTSTIEKWALIEAAHTVTNKYKTNLDSKWKSIFNSLDIRSKHIMSKKLHFSSSMRQKFISSKKSELLMAF